MGRTKSRGALLVAAALAAAGCSGNPTTRADTGGLVQGASPTASAAAATPSTATPTASTGGKPAKGGGSSTLTVSSAGPGGGAATSTSSTDGLKSAPPPIKPGGTYRTPEGLSYEAADLYPASQDRVGLTDSTITLCMHAPFIFGNVFHNTTTDEQTFFKWLNDRGGVIGRKVNMVFTDDQYTPQGGVSAAQQCKQANPFFMTAGVGFDTVPAVEQWAETNKLLYLASFSADQALYQDKYVFQVQPSVGHFGEVAGQYAATKYPGNFGVVWRNSPNWQPGRDGFKRVVTAKGSKVVADIPVQENQGDYTSAILTLQRQHAQTVLAWVNVLEFAQLEKQAAAQGYHPRWITATFNQVTDTLGHDVDGTNGPAAVGLWVTPEFHLGDTTSPWAGEEKVMEQAFAKYDAGHTVNDIDWMFWLGARQLMRIISDCGVDCSRNKLAGMLQAGYASTTPPLCAMDFARGKGKLGSFAFNVMEGTNRGGTSGWKQVATCRETF